MAAFLIADILEVTDPDRMAAYGKAAGQTLETHGGRIVAGSPGEVVEGDWSPGRVVVVQFDNMDKLKTWYFSPEYQALVKERQAASRGNVIMVDGG